MSVSKGSVEGPAASAVGPSGVHLSASGYDRLIRCETSWVRNRLAGRDESEAKGEPLRLGTLLHLCVQAFWRHEDWRTAWQAALNGEPGWDPGFTPPSEFVRAESFMADYVSTYGPDLKNWIAHAVELDFDLPLPGVRGVRVRGFVDLVLRCTREHLDGGGVRHVVGELVGREIKSMGRWGREVRAPWDPQVWIYAWALRHLGYPVTGMQFDAIGTAAYAGKPPSYRCRLIPVPWSDDMWATVLDGYQRSGRRVRELVAHPERATKALGDACTWCPYFRPCVEPMP